MSETKKQVGANLIPAIISIAFAAFALMFGMSEWKQLPTTASAPPAATQQ
jgi:hypothetical protein